MSFLASFYNCGSMSGMPPFSHHHHHTPSSIVGPLSVSPTHGSASLNLSNSASSQQCLMQTNAQQSHQMQRDLISPSPYQCHMSVRSGPLTPMAPTTSVPASAGSNGLSVSNNYSSSARHSPCSPSQSGCSLYPLNSSVPTSFGIANPANGTTGIYRKKAYAVVRINRTNCLNFFTGLLSPSISMPIPVAIPVQTTDMTSQYWSRLQ